MNRAANIFFQCFHVQGNAGTHKLLGYVEYFGYQRVAVLLSDSYAGRAFSQCCTIDPIAGEELSLNV